MEALKLQPVITAFSVFGVFVCIVLTYYALVNLFKSFPRIRSKKDKEAIMDEDADAHHHVETYTGEPNIKLFWCLMN